MARRKIKTISITPDLSAKLGQYPEENWSAIACRAFEVRLNELKIMNITDTEERAVARLKVSKMRATDRFFSSGEMAGARYVIQHGEFSEMERLERWNARLGTDRDVVMDAITIDQVARVMDEDAQKDIADNVRSMNDDDVDDSIWVNGFISGALTKYNELKAKMD